MKYNDTDSKWMRIGIIVSIIVFISLSGLILGPIHFDDNSDIGDIGDRSPYLITNDKKNDIPYETPTRNDEIIWPMYKRDLKNTGCNPNAVYENPGKLRWKTSIPGSLYLSSPSIYNNQLLIGSTESVSDRSMGICSLFLNGTIKKFYNTNKCNLQSIIWFCWYFPRNCGDS